MFKLFDIVTLDKGSLNLIYKFVLYGEDIKNDTKHCQND